MASSISEKWVKKRWYMHKQEMGKEKVAYIIVLAIKKVKSLSFSGKQMQLEIILLTE